MANQRACAAGGRNSAFAKRQPTNEVFNQFVSMGVQATGRLTVLLAITLFASGAAAPSGQIVATNSNEQSSPRSQGACCFPEQVCVIVTPQDCALQGGLYLGDGTICGSPPCPCTLTCPPSAIASVEPVCADEYVDVTNGGCYAATPDFEAIACGDTVCGTAGTYIRGGQPQRDLDWYRFSVTIPTVVTWTAEAEFPLQIFLATNTSTTGGDCPATTIASVPATATDPYVQSCEQASVSATLPAGTYYAVIGPRFRWLTVDCAARYFATLSCTPTTITECEIECPPCADPEHPTDSDPDCSTNYIDTFNPGCSRQPSTFSPMACGQTICGRSEASSRDLEWSRDEDWYSFSLESNPCDLIWTVRAEFPVEVLLLRGGTCPGVELATGLGFDCVEAVARVNAAPPGTYWFVIRPQLGADVPCGARYLAHLLCCQECDDELAQFDAQGNLIYPPDIPAGTEYTEEEGETTTGTLSQLYPNANTATDLWYPCFPCKWSIGGDELEDSLPDPDDVYDEEELEGFSAEELAAQLEQLESQLGEMFAKEPDRLDSFGRVSNGYTPPAGPHCTLHGCNYVFGGRDIVFVHGLRTTPLEAVFFGSPANEAEQANQNKWRPANGAAGWMLNPGFYDLRCQGNGLGYWKKGANLYWRKHIQKFLRDRGIMNRYLIVCYGATERLDVAMHAVLTQIEDAMQTGMGVIDPLEPPCVPFPDTDPDTPFDEDSLAPTGTTVTDFGTPSFVIISHSTGGPVTSAALGRAQSLGAGHIAAHCKAHIALHGALEGSRIATAGVAAGAVVTGTVAAPINGFSFLWRSIFGGDLSDPYAHPEIVFDSNLVDLMPSVMQSRWGPWIANSPVRTLTIAGGHPTYNWFLKRICLPGFNDGVVNINSQVANPNPNIAWPSGYRPTSKREVYDMGLKRTLGHRKRANRFYRQQDPLIPPPVVGLLHPRQVSGGAVPYRSPSGMVQPVEHEYRLNGGFSPLRRRPNHFSFILSTAMHFDATPGFDESFLDRWPHYLPTPRVFDFDEKNDEETTVITDEAVYQPFSMPFTAPLGIDGQPLLNGPLPMEEVVRFKRIRFGSRNRNLYRWKRYYHLLAGWQSMHEMDYVYRYVLPDLVNSPDMPNSPCRAQPWQDCNENGVDDRCEVAIEDCNHNDVPDDCDIRTGTSRDLDLDGVPDECCQRTRICYLGGRADAFASPSEPAAPRTQLAALAGGLTACAGFDESAPGRSVAHSFTGLPSNIDEARLEIRIRAINQDAANDTISLGLVTSTGPMIWQRPLSTLIPSMPWTTGSDTTLYLNLSSLSSGGANLLPAVSSLRLLDLVVSDDTMVDYVRLTVSTCRCVDSPTRTLRVGFEDAFSATSLDPPTSRSAPLDSVRPAGTWKNCDDATGARGFGHTFQGLPPAIVRATLEIRMRAHAGASNDTIQLSLNAVGGPAVFEWTSPIARLPEANGSWNAGADRIFRLNLVNLRPTEGSENLLGALVRGNLDLYVADDTEVDHAVLRVWCCPPPRNDFGLFDLGLGQAILEPQPDNTLVVSGLTDSGEDGVRFDSGQVEGMFWTFDMPDNPAIGATLRSETRGQINDAADRPVAIQGVQAVPEGLRILAPDFSTLGASSYGMRILRRGNVVYQASNLDGSPGLLMNEARPKRCSYKLIPPKAIWKIGTAAAAEGQLALEGGPTVLADQIEFIPEGATVVAESISGLAATATRMSAFYVRDVGITAFGLPCRAFGGAVLEPTRDVLALTHIGDTGLDGVALDVSGMDQAQFDFPNVNPAEWRPGAAVQLSMVGRLEGNPKSSMIGVQAYKDAQGRYAIVAGPWRDWGLASQRAEIYQGGVFVAAFPNRHGPIADADAAPTRWTAAATNTASGRLDGVVLRYSIDTALVVDGQTFVGDELRILVETENEPPPAIRLEEVRLSGQSIDTFAIREVVTHRRCIGDITGDSQVGLNDLTQLLSHIGEQTGDPEADGDLDVDGDVDLQDLAILLANFGRICS